MSVIDGTGMVRLPLARRILPVLLLLSFLPSRPLHAELLAWGEEWTNVFSERDVVLHVRVAGRQAMQGRVSWQYTVNRAIIQRGEEAVVLEPGRPVEVAISLRIPPVKPGLVIETELSAEFSGDVADGIESTILKPLYVFHEDVFADRGAWLEASNIALFDPAQTTAERLQEAGAPFRAVRDVDALTELEAHLVIVGESISLESYKGLMDALQTVARAGSSVLCLAPEAGAFALPGAEGHAGPRPESVVLRQRDLIAELDKRLDATFWRPDGRIEASGLDLRAGRGGVVGVITPGDEAGWPWVAFTYPGGGRLVVCGFAVIDSWEASPTPRYLLLSIIERLTGRKRNEE